MLSLCISYSVLWLLSLQFEYQLRLARMVLGNDASALGGLVSNSGGWLGASDETHCGKMATLQVGGFALWYGAL